MQRRSSNQKSFVPREFSDSDLPIFPQQSYSRNQSEIFQGLGRNQSFGSIDNGSFLRTRSSRAEIQHNDLFAGFKQQKKPNLEYQQIELLETPSLRQRYDKQSLQYAKYMFDDRVKLIIRRIAIRAYNAYKDREEHPFLSFSIQRMLSILAKKLFLNRFQLLFLQYVLQQTKWKYEIDIINRHTAYFKSFLNSSEQEGNSTIFKQVEIYFLYCGYYSKRSLNQLPVDNIYYEFLKTVCPQFRDKFADWTTASQVSSIRINPKILNNIFKRLSCFSDRQREQVQNYSLIVQEIIDISPAYNADKGAGTGKTRKNKKRKTEQPHEPQQYIEAPLSSIAKQQEDIQVPFQRLESENQFGQMPALRNKKQTSFMSLVDGVDPQAYIRNNMNLN